MEKKTVIHKYGHIVLILGMCLAAAAVYVVAAAILGITGLPAEQIQILAGGAGSIAGAVSYGILAFWELRCS